jgi:L-lactate dehydrogenase complex protein LldG
VLDARLDHPAANLLPRVDGDVVERFLARAAGLATTVTRVARLADVPAAVAGYVAGKGPRATLVVGTPLADLSWPAPLTVRAGVAGEEDSISVTPCFAAVAETGSLVLLAGPESPTTLNFVPDDHIVVVRRDQVVRHMEEVWARIRGRGAAQPRTVNFISGPSRTADIEQIVQLGVHGPRRLHVVFVDD